jgi:hypothetical protein
MASVGVEAEAGGTAVQKVLIDITKQVAMGGDKLAKYAETAGMSATQFADAWRTDPAAAFTAFVEGLGAAGDDALVILDELDMKDQRLIRAFLSLAGAGDLLSESIANSNKLWEENNAMQDEAAKRFETFESKVQLAKNSLIDVGISIGNILMPFVERLITWLHDKGVPALETFVEWFDKLPGPVKTAAVAGLALLAVIGPLVLGAGMFAGALANLIPLLIMVQGALTGTNARLFLGMLRSLGVDALGAATKVSLLKAALVSVAATAGLLYVQRELQMTSAAIDDARSSTKEWISTLGDGPAAVSKVSAAIRDQERELKYLQSAQGQVATGFKGLFTEGTLSAPGREIAAAKVRLDELGGALDDIDSKQVKLNQNAADSMASLGSQSLATQALTGAAQGLGLALQAQGQSAEFTMSVNDEAAAKAAEAAAIQEAAAQKVFAGLQLQDEALGEFTQAVSESYGSATSLVAAFGAASAVTSDQVMAHFDQQVKAAQAWSTNLIALGQAGIDQGLLKQLAEAGPKAAPLVQALLDAVAEGNLETINKAQEDLATILGDTVNQLNGVTPEAIQAGKDAGGGWAGALAMELHGAQSDTGNITSGIVSDLNNVGNTHPKPTITVSSNAGTAIPHYQGLINSIQGKTVYVTVAYRAMTGGITGGLAAGLRHGGGEIFHGGGLVRMHSGGLRSDERMIIAQAGEFMIQRSAVQALGVQAMRMINSGKLPRARGGDGAAMPVPTMRGIDSVQPIQIDVEVPVSLDGKQIAYSSRKVNLKTDRRNADRR